MKRVLGIISLPWHDGRRWASSLCGMGALLALSLAVAPHLAWAELYSYIDDDGVVHFTNVPDEGATPKPVAKTENTFEWKDELGALRRVHRVDVDRYDDLIREAARYYSLPPALIKAVVAVESSFEASAVSKAGAQGLMQLIPSTAAEMAVRDPFDARQNIFGGARYLRILANRFGGDLRRTIAAYNAGPTAVDKYDGVPNYAETRRYVQRVITLYRHYLEHWSN